MDGLREKGADKSGSRDKENSNGKMDDGNDSDADKWDTRSH